jgi:DNA-binding protein
VINIRDNNIFIGGKPFMNYVTGVVMQFTTKNLPEVIIKARGKFISRAVDIAEIASKRFLNGSIRVKDIKIDSEGFKNKEGKDVRVSTIEIKLANKNPIEKAKGDVDISKIAVEQKKEGKTLEKREETSKGPSEEKMQ